MAAANSKNFSRHSGAKAAGQVAKISLYGRCADVIVSDDPSWSEAVASFRDMVVWISVPIRGKDQASASKAWVRVHK